MALALIAGGRSGLLPALGAALQRGFAAAAAADDKFTVEVRWRGRIPALARPTPPTRQRAWG
jgi:hypothetical protein